MFCLDPPLDSIPKDQWFCFTCLSGTGGRLWALTREKNTVCQASKPVTKSFVACGSSRILPLNAEVLPHAGDITKTRIGDVTVSEYDVEEEFWPPCEVAE